MITTPKDYYNLYHRIQSENPPNFAILLPTDEKIYHVDLDSRVIESPEYLSVEKDHRAETIYFTVNRFYDFFDLSQSVCVIQYINAKKESRAYVVPYFDITTYEDKDLILFPWIVDGEVTKAPGTIEYNIRFYKLSDSGKEYLYNLSTLSATSQILYGIGDIQTNNYVSLGIISEETFNACRVMSMPLYIKSKEDYEIIEVYQEGLVYYTNIEYSFLASLKDDIYQTLSDIERTDIYWEESWEGS